MRGLFFRFAHDMRLSSGPRWRQALSVAQEGTHHGASP